jgi:tetratricopeptide (TPR) repeat protein
MPGMDADVLYRLGRYFHGQQKYDQALRMYAQVLAVDPGHADALNATGVIHSLRGESQLAEAAFRRAIAEAPNAPRAYNNLGYHLVRSGKPSEAITMLERARSLDGRDEQVQVNIAMARQMLEAPVAAQEAPTPAAAPSPAPAETATAVATAPTPNVELRRVNDGIFELHQAAAAPTTPAVVAAAPAPAPAKAVATVAPRVEVSNGHGATGLAREVSRLAAPGARLTNNRPFGAATSRVEYVAGAEQAARDIESRLPVAVPLMPVARLDRAGVRVLLGKDFPRHPSAVARANDEHRRIALTTTP